MIDGRYSRRSLSTATCIRQCPTWKGRIRVRYLTQDSIRVHHRRLSKSVHGHICQRKPMHLSLPGKLAGWLVCRHNTHPDLERSNKGENCTYYTQIFTVHNKIHSTSVTTFGYTCYQLALKWFHHCSQKHNLVQNNTVINNKHYNKKQQHLVFSKQYGKYTVISNIIKMQIIITSTL